MPLNQAEKKLELYYGSYVNGNFVYTQGVAFEIKANGTDSSGNALASLTYAECSQMDNNTEECVSNGWSNGVDLLSGNVVLTMNSPDSHFLLVTDTSSPSLNIALNGFNNTSSNKVYFQDDKFKFETSVPLENLR